MKHSFLKMAVLAFIALGFVACGDDSASGGDKDKIAQKANKELEKLCDEGVSEICYKFTEKYKGDEAKKLAYLEKGCNGKDKYGEKYIGKSCNEIADIYAKKLEGDKAKQYYAKSCENGYCSDKLEELDTSAYLDSLIKFGEKYGDWDRNWGKVSKYATTEKVAQALTKSCENGAGSACYFLYKHTDKKESSLFYAKRVCEVGLIENCADIIGGKLCFATYSANEWDKFCLSNYSAIEKRCQNGEMEFCEKIYEWYSYMRKEIEYLDNYGRHRSSGSSEIYDEDEYKILLSKYREIISGDKLENIEAHYKNLCKSNKTKYCKIGNEEQKSKSQEELAQSCENGDGDSCESLGDMYEEKLDGKQATAYYQKGCEYGNSSACYNLKRIEKDKEKLVAIFKKMCDNNVGSACIVLGSIHEAKDDYTQAMALYAKGYELGELQDGYNNLIGFYKKTVNDYRDFESEAYWLGYHKGNLKKAKQSVKEVKQMRSKIRGELLKYLPNLCKTKKGEACDILWSLGD